MSLRSQLDADLATAMKSGDTERTGVIRLVKSALQTEQIKVGHELSDDEALKVVQREAKQRRDSIGQYRQGGREDLAASEAAELVIVQGYLPEQMSDAELEKLVDEVITETGADGVQHIGMVIGAVMQRVAGRAEGGAVSQVVRKKLT